MDILKEVSVYCDCHCCCDNTNAASSGDCCFIASYCFQVLGKEFMRGESFSPPLLISSYWVCWLVPQGLLPLLHPALRNSFICVCCGAGGEERHMAMSSSLLLITEKLHDIPNVTHYSNCIYKLNLFSLLSVKG